METTRPFRYDLNQIPYSYTVEVTNRLQGLDLIDRVPEELRTEVHNIVQEFSSVHLVTQSSPTLCNPMDCSMPGLPVHHQIPELAQSILYSPTLTSIYDYWKNHSFN